MRIRVADIPSEGKELDFSLSPQELNERLRIDGAPDQGAKPVSSPNYTFVRRSAASADEEMPKAELFLEPEGNSIQVTGGAEATFKTLCARCAEDVEKPLKVRLNIIVKPHSERARETEDDELSLAYYDGEEIDCSDLVKEYLVLALPYTVLCSENCKGLCPKCGQNLNISQCACPSQPEGDERFALLKNLKLNLQ